MSIQAKVLPFELRRPRGLPDVDANALAEQCRQAALKHLELALQRVLDNVDDALFALADKAESGTAQNSYFDAMRDIRLKRDRIMRDYTASFLRLYGETLAGVVRIGKDGLQDGETGGLGFVLVGEQEMEELVAVDNLVAKSRDRFRDALFGLEHRYGTLLGRSDPDHNSNPVDPRALCQAFRDAIGALEVDIKIKLIVYKLFDQYVMWNLGALYEEINALLAKAGVLPHLKHFVRKSTGGVSPRRSHATPNTPTDDGLDARLEEPDLMTDLPADTFDRLQYLAGLYRAGHGMGPNMQRMGRADPVSSNPGQVYSMDDMLSVFSRIQYEGLSGNGGASVFLDREALLAALQSGGGAEAKQLALVHDNTIDVVGMLFDFVLEDPSLPESIKGQICRLQIPIIKIALLDSTFFSRKQHPARRLLNELAYAGAAWDDLDPAEQESLYDIVRQVVEYVLCKFERDAAIFEAALDDLLSTLATMRSQQEGMRARRSAEVAATAAVLAAVGERAVPAVVAQYLSETWCLVLTRVAMTEGVDGAEWQRCCGTMDRLLWTVEPKHLHEEREQLVGMLPELLGELRAEMEANGCTGTEIDTAIATLESCHLASIRGGGEASETQTELASDSGTMDIDIAAWIKTMRQDITELTDPDHEVEARAANKDGDIATDYPTLDEVVRATGDATPVIAEDDPHVQVIRAMSLGTWVEFVQADKVRRGKLAWKDNDYGEYLFVDRRYKVVADKGIAELATDLTEGRACVVEDVAFLDRALDAVMNRLMGGAVAH